MKSNQERQKVDHKCPHCGEITRRKHSEQPPARCPYCRQPFDGVSPVEVTKLELGTLKYMNGQLYVFRGGTN